MKSTTVYLIMAALSVACTAEVSRADAQLERGAYLYQLAGCENCHTDREHQGARLAGGRQLVTPLGTFYAPNITPDRQTGIGRWSEANFVRALRDGESPGGDHYYPSFPYTSYTRLTDGDLKALWAYLRTVPAVHQPNKPHELPWYLNVRALLAVWNWWYFDAGSFQPKSDKSAAWNRGAYLVQGAGHCGECHTPRDSLGGYWNGYGLAGTLNGPEGRVVPNITPDKKYGIGRWNLGDLAQYLQTGMRPDGDAAGGLMAEIIDNGLKHLTAEDRQAIAAYLADLAPVPNPAARARSAKQRSKAEDY